MTKYKLALDEDTPSLTLCWEHDTLLVEQFLEAGVHGVPLAKANRCCLFLWATLVADITSGDGRQIL